MKPVSELLRLHPSTLWHVRPDDTVFEALRVLAEREAGALMVMDRGQLVGMLSERDYTRKVALAGRNSRETRVHEIMTRDVVTVGPCATTRECMSMMSQRRIRHLPVLEAGTVLGMISIRDLLDDVIAEQDGTIAQLESYIQS